MDGIANVARQQQSQVGSAEVQGRAQEQSQQVQQSTQTRTKQSDVVKEIQESAVDNTKRMDSKESVEDLVKQLNDALAPLNTNIKFGVDRNDIFYVAAIDVKTDKMIRRFPAEQAQDFLPKMQEVSGILFDSKG
ncbi:flagellar protein FlaG [Sulfurimonas autotrophica]|uniref:Flagellar protein FlaG protein n=1 Tax=Sulfurimonas autotrophica (strain ATCC BAA-671 / DSM 16294 / JCM 11897 / OK10) TaxID=563040 RepID=E0URB8_SULAO|nr:flagellar protein FlaG [Sulfurimonas autotrophica]ADN08928.1 flagellar protein FlaG protein [Sulfurimonas autotrophica DSM 16294]